MTAEEQPQVLSQREQEERRRRQEMLRRLSPLLARVDYPALKGCEEVYQAEMHVQMLSCSPVKGADREAIDDILCDMKGARRFLDWLAARGAEAWRAERRV